jgi:Transposase DNA-binding
MEETDLSWIDQEFSSIDFKDIRLVKRFKYILTKFMQHAQSNISSCFGSWSSIKACYRFFNNNKVESSIVLEGHKHSTISRINESNEKILIIHDTTYIDYKKRKKNDTLDKVFRGAKGKDGSLGLILHNSLALTESGVPVGLLGQQFIRRATINHPDRTTSSAHSTHTRSITEKESYRWIECQYAFKIFYQCALKIFYYRVTI